MKQKTAIISGGTDGMGKGSVLQFLKDGFNVATFSTNYSSTPQNCAITSFMIRL